MKVADGGYLSWSYGTSLDRQTAWNENIFWDYIFVLDGDRVDRHEVFAEYKQKRSDRREEDPRKMATYQMVKKFQTDIIQNGSPNLIKLMYPTLEADDLIALLSWRYRDLELMAIDKDLLQLLPYLRSICRLDGSLVTIDNFISRLPQYAQRHVKDHNHIPLVLSLLGDKSDSIPRLIPPYSGHVFERIMGDERPWRCARSEYGNDVLRNVLISLLPYPRLFGLTDDEIWDRLDQGAWNPEDDLLELVDPTILILINHKWEELNGRFDSYTGSGSGRSTQEQSDKRPLQLAGGNDSGREAEGTPGEAPGGRYRQREDRPSYTEGNHSGGSSRDWEW